LRLSRYKEGSYCIMTTAIMRPHQWQGTPYSPQQVVDFCAAIEQAFGLPWLDERLRKIDPNSDAFRRAWQGNDQQGTILLCRVGRDIRRLWDRGDAKQNERLGGMIAGQIIPSPDQAMHFLYELHIATLFDETKGVVGRLAEPGAAGLDVTIELPGDRTILVSCKRAKVSKGEHDFKKCAEDLFPRLVAAAGEQGVHVYEALVATDPPLVDHDPETILRTWAQVCADYRQGSERVAGGSPSPLSFIAMAQGWTARMPAGDRATVMRAPYIQFISAIPHQEHKRIHHTFVEGARKLRHKSVPDVSDRHVKMIAMDVTEYATVSAVAQLLHKEFVAGHYADISAVLLTRAIDAGTMGPERWRTMAEEYYLLVNGGALVPLWEFLGDDTLTILVEGFHLFEGPPRIVVPHPEHPIYLPDGYIHSKGEYEARFRPEGYANLYIPPLIPPILLSPDETRPYLETPLPLTLHSGMEQAKGNEEGS